MTQPDSAQPNPVTRIARRRAKPGCDAAYEAVLRVMFAEVAQFPGFRGADLIPPESAGGEYQVVMRFDSQQQLDAWDVSELRQTWHARLHAVAEGDPDYRLLSGLEAWFALPAAPANHAPVRWKMAIATWLGIFPTVSLVLWFIAPRLVRLLFPWLFRD
ncbi:MAG: antibiotic biosynthesis monooxygenase [Thermomicrobiales bacterium]|nr:MAG: antibiotic biosynthesis monooxygenase [Thermomicrobiales bacterium]